VLELVREANVHVVDGAVVGDAVVGPLGKSADVLGDATCIEQAELLQHCAAVPGEIARIGACRAVGLRQREL
jgi:hypothetical protein